jgi:hypothetical protein
VSVCVSFSDQDDLLSRVNKLKVTMISWSCNDHFIITAANDTAVRIWDSTDFSLLHMLRGHKRDVYVLEAHAVDERILMTAGQDSLSVSPFELYTRCCFCIDLGHDSHIILWNVETGEKLKEFENKYDSDVGVSGGAALLEGKSSSDGLTYVVTDSQGSLSIYGFGSSTDYLKVPDHQFFHTDFRPLIRDANGYVLDEQTQLAPHLMPPPYLVNADGNPHPPEYQRIVCGCKPKEKSDQCNNETEDALSTRDHVEGTNRLDAVIARLQREQQGYVTSGVLNDSSDSGVGSRQVDGPSVVQPQQTTASGMFHSGGQQILQSTHVGLGQQSSLMHTHMTNLFPNSSLPGPLLQSHMSGVGVYGQNTLYSSAGGMVGPGLHQAYNSVQANWPLVGVPFTQPGNLLNSGQHPIFAGNSFMTAELPFSETSGLGQTFMYGSLSRPAPNSLAHCAQSRVTGMNLYDGTAQPLAYPVIVPAAAQTMSSVSRLRPIAPKTELSTNNNNGAVASLSTIGSSAESGPSRIGFMSPTSWPNQVSSVTSQPSVVSSLETHSRHNANYQDSQAGRHHEDEDRENIEVEVANESQNSQEHNRRNEPLTGSVASFLGIDHKEALMWWRSRVVVPDIPPPLARHQELRQHYLAEEELRLFTEESSKSPPQAEEPPQPVRPVDSPRTQRRRRRNVLQQQLAEAAANALASTRRRTRVVSLRSDDDLAIVSSSSSAEEFEEEWHMSSESSEYSDWIGEGVSVQPRVTISRSQRPSRYRRHAVISEDEEEEEEPEPQEETAESEERPEVTISEAEASAPAVDTSRAQSSNARAPSSNARARQRRRAVAEVRETPAWPPVGVNLSAYVPSPWLLQTEPTLNPFFPQLGDKVVYCWQGHEQYINAVILNDVYKIKTKHFPWQRLHLRPQEVCMVLSMHFVVGPPTLCSMKLGILVKGQSGTSVHHHRTFSLRYHDMADVPDFLIPYDHFKRAILRPWTPGDRFQCKIDDAWWTGSIIAREPWQLSVPDSLWQCFLVQWDTGEEQEKLSPWDIEVTSEEEVRPRRRSSSLSEDLALALQLSSAPGVQTRRQAAMSGPSGTSEEQNLLSNLIDILNEDFDNEDGGWGEEDEAIARDRILRGLDAILSLPISQPFQQPVNVEEYPDYYLVVPYPIDLGTIRQRLNNGYYRRLNSFLWDVKTIHKNAATYNEEDSQIVESAQTLTELLCKFASDSNCSDLMVFYNEQNREDVPEEGEEYQAESAESSDSATEVEIEADPDLESTEPVRETLRASSSGPHNSCGESGNRKKGKRRRLSSEVSSESHTLQAKRAKTWVPLAVDLLDEMIRLPFSEPFRAPVDVELYPDYVEYVECPMDLSTVKRKLQNGQYDSPTEFCEDIRLIFSNSRLYNRAPKSQIFRWTNKLSMHFESRVIAFLSNSGVDHAEVSRMIQKIRPSSARIRRTSSNDYDEATSESSTSNLDTNESSSSDEEESDVEETVRVRGRTGKKHAVNGRTQKRAPNRLPSSEDSDYGAGADAETSSGECTGSDDDYYRKRVRRQQIRRGNPSSKRSFRSRKGSSEEPMAVSRPRRQLAGRRLPGSQNLDSFGSYSSRPPRQAAMRALENVAMLDSEAESWAEKPGQCSRRAGSRRSSSLEVEGEFPSGQASCSNTRYGRIVRPSTRTRTYGDV